MPMPPITNAATIARYAAEAMALRARECQTSVRELFAHSHEVSFDLPGFTAAEHIEHTLDITPDLIERAEAVLADWRKNNAE